MSDVKFVQSIREQNISEVTHCQGDRIRTYDLPDQSGRATVNQLNR